MKVSLAEIYQSYPPEKAQRDRLQNPYSYYVLAPLAFRLARVFINQRVSANTITLLGLLCVICGLSLLSCSNFLLGFIFLNLAILLDNIDGHVARCGGEASLFGALFDEMVSWCHFSLLPICLALGLFQSHPEAVIFPFAPLLPSWSWFAIGVVKLFSYLFAIVLGERVELLVGEQRALERSSSQPWVVFAKGLRELESPLSLIAAATGLLGVFFFGYACYQFSVLLYAIGRALRDMQRADQQKMS